MQVAVAGFLRTGTTSLALALDQLGYGPCYNMRTLIAEPHRTADWVTAEKNPELADWHRIFDGFGSAVGSPATPFWREIADAFPAAKIILTIRDPQRWYESASATISEAIAPQPLTTRLLTRLSSRHHDADNDIVQAMEDMQQRVWEREVGGHFTDRDRTIAVFEAHIAAVRAHFPADRLLVFPVRDGWGPLCAFLGVPEPSGPFPHENDRDAFRRRQQAALSQGPVSRLLTSVAATPAAWGRRLMRGTKPPARPTA
ncbi:MAG TPA: sulfotransferase [Streptosporangiaceae bacterium]|jgi:hypothetical protein